VKRSGPDYRIPNEPVKPTPGGDIPWLSIQAKDGTWHWAKGELDGANLIVRSDGTDTITLILPILTRNHRFFSIGLRYIAYRKETNHYEKKIVFKNNPRHHRLRDGAFQYSPGRRVSQQQAECGHRWLRPAGEQQRTLSPECGREYCRALRRP